MTGSAALVVALVAALASPLIAYVVAARRMSGRIDTTTADKLWDESTSMRHDYRDRLRDADREIGRLRERVSDLTEANSQLQKKVEELEEQVVRIDGVVNGR